MLVNNLIRHYKKILAILIIGLTIFGFIYYFVKHPHTLDSLKNLSVINISLLLALYFLILFCLVLVLKFSLDICNLKMKWLDNLQLNIWSNIINFFGPLQSGPGVRALYLKKNYGLTLKKFLYLSLIYYGFIALISLMFIGIGAFKWYFAVGLIILSVLVVYVGFSVLTKKIKKSDRPALTLKPVLQLFLITLVQLSINSLIYFIELKIVNKNISYHQALCYCGVANLALFVSITPGAIGFRESFLLFTQKLHHISAANILSASLIDRSVYLFFLLILIVLASFTHIGTKLRLTAKNK